MITHQFVENIGRRLKAVQDEEQQIAAEMQRVERTAQEKLRGLRDEAVNIESLLAVLDRFDQSAIEAFMAGQAVQAAPEPEPAEPAPAIIAVEIVEDPTWMEPAAEAPKPTPEPEARGLKPADAAILIVMRAQRQADGICRMSMSKVAKLAGVPQKSAAEQCVKRLRTAGIIMPTKEDQHVFHVADRGQRVPIAIQTKLAAQAPARFSLPTTSEVQLDEKLFDLIARAARAGGGQALFELSKLANQMGVNQLRLDCSLTRLAEQRRLVRCKSLPGHATFEVLDRQEAAE